mgnify:CR=1 FL=1
MTYIEFFDKTAVENVCACLTYAPERVIYIGDNEDLMNAHIANYTKVFSDRKQNIAFSCRTTSKSNLANAVKLLTELVQTYEDCVFGITGGDELLMLALGIVYQQNPDRNIQIHRINVRNGTVSDCDKDGNTIYSHEPQLTIKENIRIYGGDVMYCDVNGDETYQWDLSEEFLADFALIWARCKLNVRYWNKQIGYFEAMKEIIKESGKERAEELTLTVKRTVLEAYLARNKVKFKPARGIIQYLTDNNLLTNYDDSDEKTVTVSFKNPQVMRCLTKAGNALELKIFIAAKNVKDKNDPVYDDALNGVLIDWDGKPHDEETENIYDTENEVDVLLMHGIVPVFISCKNGVVHTEELYKLETVAQRFGSKYAKKVLIATSIPTEGEAGAFFRQRAKDMRIKLIEGVQYMTDAELEKKLKNLWKN